MRRWRIVAGVAAVSLGVILLLWKGGQADEESGVDYAYGFSGEVHRFGDPEHEIVYGKGIELAVLEPLGAYLEQIGYFSPDYGGVIQIRSRDRGYDVYLTYSSSYWDLPEFVDEVSSIQEDLESNVLKSPIRIILADEDEAGVHSRVLE